MEDGESVRARLRRRVYSLDIASIQATNTGVLVAAAKHVEDTRSRQASVFAREAEIRDGHALSAIDSIDDRLQDLDQTLQDGFNGLGHMLLDQFEQTQEMLEGLQARVDELIKVGKTPTKTHAFEQFDEARKAMEQGWYTEALRFLDGALNGVPNVSAGYKVEWRFYALLGKILLALSKQEDLVAAEAAFLCVVRYAEPESKAVAAEAAGQAARVAYTLGRPHDARTHMQRSVEIGGMTCEKAWALAKFAMAAYMKEEAERELDALVARLPFYLEKAEKDPDFQKYGKEIVFRVQQNQQVREQKVRLPAILKRMREELRCCDAVLDTMPEVAARQEILVGWRTILEGPTPSHTVADALEIRMEREFAIMHEARRKGQERIGQEQVKASERVWEEILLQRRLQEEEQERVQQAKEKERQEQCVLWAAQGKLRAQAEKEEQERRAQENKKAIVLKRAHREFEVQDCAKCRAFHKQLWLLGVYRLILGVGAITSFVMTWYAPHIMLKLGTFLVGVVLSGQCMDLCVEGRHRLYSRLGGHDK